MNVLVVEPGMMPYEKEINGLNEMQAVVGGYIEAIYPYKEMVAIVCNEEGLLMDLPFNRSMDGGYGGIFGTFFVCGLSEESFDSLTPKQMEFFKERFKHAEILLGFKDEFTPLTLKINAMPHIANHGKQKDEPSR